MTTTKPKIGALWERHKKDGEIFLSGEITIRGVATKIVCWVNQYKEDADDKKPNFVIYEETPRFVSDNPRRVVNPKPAQTEMPQSQSWDDDDIPF